MASALFLRIVNTSSGILGILGNSLVNVVIICEQSMHTKTNALILHQAIIDFLASIFILLHEYIPPFNPALPGTWGQFLCSFWNTKYFMLNFFFLSTYSLLAVTFERYLAIVYPYRYQRIFGTKMAIGLILACIWVIVLTFRVYVFFQWSVNETGMCVAAANGKGVAVVIFLLQYGIPLALMTLMYAGIAIELSKSARRILPTVTGTTSQNNRNEQGESLLRARRNIFKALLIVFVTFIICWTLNQFLFFLHNMGVRKLNFTSTIYVISVALMALNVFVNPVIYSFKYKRFQRAMRRLLYRTTGRLEHLNAMEDAVTGMASNSAAQAP